MDGARGEFLAGSGLAFDQHGRIAPSNFFDESQGIEKWRRAAHHRDMRHRGPRSQRRGLGGLRRQVSISLSRDDRRRARIGVQEQLRYARFAARIHASKL
jgi:hypothetical protein